MATTLNEIAELAEVSRSTVSRVINNHPSVRPEVRQRVLDIIDQTGYRPNVAARSLRSRRLGLIGLVLPQTVRTLFSDPYFPRLTEGIAVACNQHDYTLSLFIEHDEIDLLTRITRPGLMDGLVVQATSVETTLIDRLLATKLPFIVAGRPGDAPSASYVDVDNVSGAYAAVTHLIRLGYKRIATVTGPISANAAHDRFEGYQVALQERGRALDEALIVEGDFTEASGYHGARRLLVHRPDAIFVASDGMAYGALRALREARLDIPGDVALVGFDDLFVPGADQTFLTTVHQPVRDFGIRLIEELLDIIEYGPQPPRRVIMPTRLMVRQSCGAFLRNRHLDAVPVLATR